MKSPSGTFPLLIGLLTAAAALAAPVTLYDAATGLPGAPWFTFAPGISVTSVTSGPSDAPYTRFDSTGFGSLQGGTSRGDLSLNTSEGFWLRFRLRLNSEAHASGERAGLSIIALGSGLEGIELGFWTDQVWAQNTGFTKGESTSDISSAVFVNYNLLMQGGSYAMFRDTTLILTGLLRDYSSFGSPYTIPNFLFIGDDTTSARASFDLASVQYEAVPESATGILTLAAMGVAYGIGVWLRR